MNLIIQHEYYKEVLSEKWLGRDIELDAIDADQEEEKKYIMAEIYIRNFFSTIFFFFNLLNSRSKNFLPYFSLGI
ncbi:MAG: hypothetical protein CEE43_10345 [Promethearchaeota archaeon Loki_b32]|nr:MAG: hypothetical protein CEE43_10345 [Candidatus Lokiarchaeota archaeon Loki_b32]